jgi:hypothetical protein
VLLENCYDFTYGFRFNFTVFIASTIRLGVPNRCVARDHEVCREIKKKRIEKIKFLVEILYI